MALLTPFEPTNDDPPIYRPALKPVEILSSDGLLSAYRWDEWKESDRQVIKPMPIMYRIDYIDGTTGLYGSDRPISWLDDFVEYCQQEGI